MKSVYHESHTLFNPEKHDVKNARIFANIAILW